MMLLCSMTYKQAIKSFQNQLENVLSTSECKAIAERCFFHLTQKSGLQLLTDQDILIDKLELQSIIDQLLLEKPIQYILGYEWFGHLQLMVNESVLIPRPETEELCMWVMEYIKTQEINDWEVIDLGTGSGCIPIYLKSKIANLKMHALDLSGDALEIAMQNAKAHHTTITFYKADMLQKEPHFFPMMDIIISNPPYIMHAEKETMQKRVLAFEPEQALFVTNNDPLQFYKAIIQIAEQKLKLHGRIFVELHQDYANETKLLFENHQFEVAIRKDMYSNMRMLSAWRQ